MYETDAGTDPGLDPRTRAMMREAFGGHACCRCGAAAERMRAGRFYCHADAPRERPADPAPARVYRHPVGVGG